MSFRLAIPWRVALQQGPPPLRQPFTFCTQCFRRTMSFHRTATCRLTGCLSRGVHSIQRCENFRFALKPSQSFGILCQPGGKNLDRDIATDARIARLLHLSHAVFFDWRDAFIWAEFVAWLERHIRE